MKPLDVLTIIDEMIVDHTDFHTGFPEITNDDGRVQFAKSYGYFTPTPDVDLGRVGIQVCAGPASTSIRINWQGRNNHPYVTNIPTELLTPEMVRVITDHAVAFVTADNADMLTRGLQGEMIMA